MGVRGLVRGPGEVMAEEREAAAAESMTAHKAASSRSLSSKEKAIVEFIKSNEDFDFFSLDLSSDSECDVEVEKGEARAR